MSFNRKDNAFERAYDLEQFLAEKGITYSISGEEWLITCPSCNRQKLYINPTTKLYICFKCEARGNLYSFISMVTDESIREILTRLKVKQKDHIRIQDPINITISNTDFVRQDCVEPEMSPLNLPRLEKIDFHNKDTLICQYLESRGITSEMVTNFALYYAPSLWRLVFPVFVAPGQEPIGWIGRDITDTHKQKYWNNPGFRKKDCLYGLHLHRERDSIVLVEGPVDALKCMAFGGLAMMGKYLSREQLNILSRMPNLRRIYIGVDPDAFESASRIAKTLSTFWSVHLLRYHDDRDLGDMHADEIAFLVRDAEQYYHLQPLHCDLKS